jgi:transposase, IS30 family
MVLMGGCRLDPGLAEVVRGHLAAGMRPWVVARVTGVPASTVYRLDRARRVRQREAVRRREDARLERARQAAERRRLLAGNLAAGMNPNQAAKAAGVPASTAYRIHRKMGGVCRPPGPDYDSRYLSREERHELARLREAGHSLRQIGAMMKRDASTISRELRRNADPRTGRYMPERAHLLARERQRRPKPSRLSRDPVLRERVQQLLHKRYSPEQVSGRLRVEHPDDPAMRVSHETIYQSLYVYPRGGLRRELQACLRTGRTVRRRRGRRDMRGRIIGAVPIGQRPPEAEGRLVPGHHEGDLIMGSKASNSAVGTIVERTTGYLTLLPLPHGHDAAAVADAIIERLSAYPAWFAKTLTWDRGTELAQHQRITGQAGIAVYFADPHAPWQRGSNENINGLLREYLPKGTDLSAWTPAQLQAIADDLNDRPRKRFGYHTPREQLAKLLAEDQHVATTP